MGSAAANRVNAQSVQSVCSPPLQAVKGEAEAGADRQLVHQNMGRDECYIGSKARLTTTVEISVRIT